MLAGSFVAGRQSRRPLIPAVVSIGSHGDFLDPHFLDPPAAPPLSLEKQKSTRSIPGAAVSNFSAEVISSAKERLYMPSIEDWSRVVVGDCNHRVEASFERSLVLPSGLGCVLSLRASESYFRF